MKGMSKLNLTSHTPVSECDFVRTTFSRSLNRIDVCIEESLLSSFVAQGEEENENQKQEELSQEEKVKRERKRKSLAAQQRFRERLNLNNAFKPPDINNPRPTQQPQQQQRADPLRQQQHRQQQQQQQLRQHGIPGRDRTWGWVDYLIILLVVSIVFLVCRRVNSMSSVNEASSSTGGGNTPDEL